MSESYIKVPIDQFQKLEANQIKGRCRDCEFASPVIRPKDYYDCTVTEGCYDGDFYCAQFRESEGPQE